jgi:hypothetical protein
MAPEVAPEVVVGATILRRNSVKRMGTCAIKHAVLAYGTIQHRERFFRPLHLLAGACLPDVPFQPSR